MKTKFTKLFITLCLVLSLTACATTTSYRDLEQQVERSGANVVRAFTALTGGGSGALDKIPTASILAGDMAMVSVGNVIYFYQWNEVQQTQVAGDPTYICPSDDTDCSDGTWYLVDLRLKILDGLTPTVLTTSTTNGVESPEKLSIYTFNNYATAGTAVTFALPTAGVGKQRCYGNYTAKTGTIRVDASAAGQYIDMDGTQSATGGYVISGGALGDKACFVGVSTTVWIMYTQHGTWTLH